MKTDYNLIRSILKIDYMKDYASTIMLWKLLWDKKEHVYRPEEVDNAYVFGGGPSLTRFLKKHNNKTYDRKTIVVSSDSATPILLKKEIIPDIIVTDLDGITLTDIFLLSKTKKKITIYVHSHGDNTDKISSMVPLLKRQKNFILIGTTQTRSIPPVTNIGGFTDGDRALIVTLFHKPKKVYLVGMDFSLPPINYSPSEKADLVFQQKKLYLGYHILKTMVCQYKDKIDFHNFSYTRLDC